MPEIKLSYSKSIDLQVLLLGNVEIRTAQDKVQIRYAKLTGLLAVLAMSAGKPLQRDYLTDLFWPDMTIQTGRQNLRRALYNLKSSLGDASHMILSNNKTITLLQSDLLLDVTEMLTGTSTIEQKNQDAAYYNQLEQKLKLYRGEFMAGFTLPDCPYFEDWLQQHRESLHRKTLGILEQLSNHFEQAHNYSKALTFALRHIELDPWNEDMRCKVMRLYSLNGQSSAALQQYESTCNVLAKELDAEPKYGTQQLASRIHSGQFNNPSNDGVLNELISELYRCVDHPDQWQHVTSKIAATMGAEKFLFASRDKASLEMKGQFHWSLGDDALEAYMAHYSNIDVLSQSLERAPREQFHTSHDLYSEKKLFSSEIYNDFCKPFGINQSIGVTFDDPDSTLYTQFACLWEAGTKKITANDIQPMNILVPHLKQFVHLRNKFEYLQKQTRSTEQIVERFSMPALLCKANGTILARNEQADDMFASSNIITAITEKIVLYQQHHKDEFSTLLHQAVNAVDGKSEFSNGTWRAHKNYTVLEFNIFPFIFRPEGLIDCTEPCALVVVSDKNKLSS